MERIETYEHLIESSDAVLRDHFNRNIFNALRAGDLQTSSTAALRCLFIHAELNRREHAKQTRSMLCYTVVITILTAVVTLATIGQFAFIWL